MALAREYVPIIRAVERLLGAVRAQADPDTGGALARDVAIEQGTSTSEVVAGLRFLGDVGLVTYREPGNPAVEGAGTWHLTDPGNSVLNAARPTVNVP